MFLWNLIFAVTVKRLSYLLLIKEKFSKKDQSFRNTTRNKLGKSNDEIYSIVFTVICATVPLI